MEITNNALQTVAVNSDVLFNETAVGGNCAIIHRQGSGLVTLRGLTQGQCRSRFRAYFSANMALPEGETTDEGLSLTIALDGEPVETTKMIITPGGEGDFWNISAAIYIDVPTGLGYYVSVRNTSDVPVLVQNANFIVERVA